MSLQRIFAIPDIHGRFDLLDKLLATLREEAKLDLGEDKLIFLGDMIDRGPDSYRVLAEIRNYQDGSPENVVVLAGNHEWLAIDACTQRTESAMDLWKWNGGDATVRSFKKGLKPFLPDDWVKWMAALPLSHEEPGFFFSHAPVPLEMDRNSSMRGKPFSKQELIWTYESDEGRYARNMLPETIGVCGHVHRLRHGCQEPRFYEHYYFLDAGCGCQMSAPLVAVEVRSKQIWWARP